MSSPSLPVFRHGEPVFVTTTITDWVDIFTRLVYKDIVVDSLLFCIEEKGLELFAWVIMSNHIHMIARAAGSRPLPDIMRDFKRFTSKAISTHISSIPESRADWMLYRFANQVRKTGRGEDNAVFQRGYHSILLEDERVTKNCLNYLHPKPRKGGLRLRNVPLSLQQRHRLCRRKRTVASHETVPLSSNN